ncbi:MAG: glycine cleavage system aminomethyltransferase GcvT [Chitinophagales bacterium]|nr:glycine cleavage system aminomethyltransferase GcvT [Chitinophagales bacterium]MCZ2392658.1 glycine cleavage system aminomethyltransferase GcvT [Chitinophagales bacterium]
MKTTPFKDIHESIGAKMVDFAGFYMPVQYTGIIDEHQTVRNGVGVFDVSHMGEFIVKGENALAFLQSIISNDLSKTTSGQAQYSYLPNERGGIIDDLLVYNMGNEEYMCVVNAGNIDKDWNWFVQNNHQGAEIQNISDNISLLAIQGPKATEALQALTDINLSEISYYRFKKGVFAGIDDVIISATGYTGLGGFELYFPKEKSEEMWKKIFEAGAPQGIKPIGLGARDTLRLEKGYCLYGNDIDDETSPIEAGLSWVTNFKKDFIGKAIIQSSKEQGVQNKLVGFKMIDKGIPRHGYEIGDADGNIIGKVTSGTQSPTLGLGIGMGYVQKEFSAPESIIYIILRGKLLKAEVVKLPFA